MTHTHNCGGTVLMSYGNGEKLYYCDFCGAFQYAEDYREDRFPTGCDEKTNQEACDDGLSQSPDSE